MATEKEYYCDLPGREDESILGASASRRWASVLEAPEWVKNWIREKRQAMIAGLETRSVDLRHAGKHRSPVARPVKMSSAEIRERDAALERAWSEFCANNQPQSMEDRQRRRNALNFLLN